MTISTPQRAVIVIPARYASTRVPGKPLAEIMGKPTVQHVYERALEAPHVHAVMVATDDHRVADAVNGFGGRCVMTSPDHASGTDWLAEVMAHVNSTFTSTCKVINRWRARPTLPSWMPACGLTLRCKWALCATPLRPWRPPTQHSQSGAGNQWRSVVLQPCPHSLHPLWRRRSALSQAHGSEVEHNGAESNPCMACKPH